MEVERICGGGPEAPAVYNPSVNGNTTRQALERMAFDVQAHGVDLLVVQFGLNDSNFWVTDRGLPRVSAAGFKANLQEIIDRGFRFGARCVQVHTNHPVQKLLEVQPFFKIAYAEMSRRYNGIIREVVEAAPADVNLVDIEAVFEDFTSGDPERLRDLLLPDGVHLSLEGHDLYFQTTLQPFTAALRRIYGADRLPT
jgi:lysophospholipase L1-like esterase